MALIEKGVEHELVPVDVFAEDGVPEWYLEFHPFGRIPAFAHGDLRFYETAAITRYVDEAFEGPDLQPAEPADRARMSQIIGMLDAYAYRPMVWEVAVERLEQTPPNEELIALGLERAELALKSLANLKSDGSWLLGDSISLADLHAAAMIGYFTKVEEGRDLLSRHIQLQSWFDLVTQRASYLRTSS